MLDIWRRSNKASQLAFAGALISSLGRLFFPASCLVCGKLLSNGTDILLCGDCLGNAEYIKDPVCELCGRPFTAEEQPRHICGTCLLRPYHFDKARALLYYRGTILQAVHGLKFAKKAIYAKTLAQLRDMWPFHMGDFDLLLPVPLHDRRLRERGFNQSLLLLREWAGTDQADKIDFSTLTRPGWSEPQSNFGRKERWKNVRGAFHIKDSSNVRDKRILLVDDVFTTGATADECARTLKKAGAQTVCVLTLARAASA